jgi:uncharacterized protein YjbI with pentapeptide repeats
MSPPVYAPVRPRVISPETGDVVLLEDEAADWLASNERGAFEIVGGPGAGKSTALARLSAAFGDAEVQFVDEPSIGEVIDSASQRRLIYVTRQPLPVAATSRVLASWTDDEVLEYLQSVHPEKTASIMSRVVAMSERRRMHGSPQLWRLVLDTLAADETQSDFREIVASELLAKLPRKETTNVMRSAIAGLLEWQLAAERSREALAATPTGREALGWLRHRIVQTLLAARLFPPTVEAGEEELVYLSGPWPRDLLAETGRQLAERPRARRALERILARRLQRYHRVAASLLHAARCGWRPPPRNGAQLAGAVLTGAVWPGIDLSRGGLWGADLSRSDLSGASLERAFGERTTLHGARLAGAILKHAKMNEANAAAADFSGAKAGSSVWKRANFQRANLRHADFRNADLREADFTGAVLTGAWLNEARLDGAILTRAVLSSADLSDARLHCVRLSDALLDNACLEGADLTEADLEFLDLADARLEDANLTRAHMTGSRLPRASLRGAILKQAGLAEVHWEFADLRDADFTNASFHLGSTRCGLVGSPIACEGSRTGFYTDEFDEQDFKSPEEIRKANLRGADLRGATVEGADFYLVDLREAKYDSRQAQHFARCGAILYDRINR